MAGCCLQTSWVCLTCRQEATTLSDHIEEARKSQRRWAARLAGLLKPRDIVAVRHLEASFSEYKYYLTRVTKASRIFAFRLRLLLLFCLEINPPLVFLLSPVTFWLVVQLANGHTFRDACALYTLRGWEQGTRICPAAAEAPSPPCGRDCDGWRLTRQTTLTTHMTRAAWSSRAPTSTS